jgi:hypothetical protein
MVGFMPCAMRMDCLLGERGIGQDSTAGRQQFERQMERRRLEEASAGQKPTFKPAWETTGHESAISTQSL